MLYVTSIHLVASVKRVGNSLAIFIPADKARAAHIKEGDTVEADLEPQAPEPFGLLKGLGLGPWTAEDKRWGWPDSR
jgi:hypothetical protein